MEFQEYIDRYIEMIKVAVVRLYPECDLTSCRSQNLLHNEYLVAIQEFDLFVSAHGRNPDQSFLMENFEKWGVARSDLFSENERFVSEAEFVAYYLAYVKKGEKLKVTEFTEEDYQFILKREAHLAKEMFHQNYFSMNGYEELDIRRSKKRQEYCLKALKRRFEEDFSRFYIGMKIKE